MIGGNTRAGHLFRCSICEGSFPEEEANFDAQIGPVCKPCTRHIMVGVAWMKHYGIDRPIVLSDVNPQNVNRLTTYFS